MNTVEQYPLASTTQVWFNRKNKRENDKEMYRLLAEITDPNVTHRCLVLPGDAWYWEQTLIAQNPLRRWIFEGVNGSPVREQRENMVKVEAEVNKELTLKGWPSVLISPRGTKKTMLSRYLGYTVHKYSLIYADFCGSWCWEYHRCLTNVFSRKLLLDNSMFIITTQIKCPRQRKDGFEMLQVAVNGNRGVHNPKFDTVGVGSEDFKTCTRGINALVHEHAKQHGYTAELVHFNMYLGDKRKHKMLTFGYKVNTLTSSPT